MPFDISAPSNFAIRPISAGMIRNLPSNVLPDGAFLRLQNYRVETYGLKKRGGFVGFDLNNDSKFDESLFDIAYFYQRSGNVDMVYIGERQAYRKTGENTVEALTFQLSDLDYLTNTAYDAATQSITLSFTKTSFTNVRSGDALMFGSTTIGEVLRVADSTLPPSVTETTNITIYTTDTTILADAWTVGDLFDVDHYFVQTPGMTPSYALLPAVEGTSTDRLIIADQSGRGLYEYNGGSTLSLMDIDSSTFGDGGTNLVTSLGAITYFDDRLWMGNTVEDGGTYQQRIRWSEPVSFGRIDPTSYIDLPYSEGPLLALLPLGSLIVAYFEDAVYIGRPSAVIGLPYVFERLETGNVGIVNSKAVVRWTDGHFFIGQDDIYFLSASSGIEAIGSPILDETLKVSSAIDALKLAQVEHDPRTSTIVFLFPDVKDDSARTAVTATRIWRFNYVTSAWSYDEVAFNNTETKTDPAFYFSGLLPSRTYLSGDNWQEWADLDPGDPDPADNKWIGATAPNKSFFDFNSWYELSDEQRLDKNLKVGLWMNGDQKQIIVQEEEDLAVDTFGLTTYPIWCLIESGDYDFGTPDSTKTVTRLSVKANQRLEQVDGTGVTFLVLLSDQMGFRWKRPQNLRFHELYNEGHADFRSTGSTFRFKLINSQEIDPYRISEIVLRVIGRGLQITN